MVHEKKKYGDVSDIMADFLDRCIDLHLIPIEGYVNDSVAAELLELSDDDFITAVRRLTKCS